MSQPAEYVSPAHPRLADAIAESIEPQPCGRSLMLWSVSKYVHTDCVFVDGRIAAGAQPVEIEKTVRDVYRAAGWAGGIRSQGRFA